LAEGVTIIDASEGEESIRKGGLVMPRFSLLCLQCGKDFELALPEGSEPTEQKCPFCGGNNVIEHNPQDFFRLLFGRLGGG
jgi:DNA-directed RNA polymerase subunit RPC12/RpoP